MVVEQIVDITADRQVTLKMPREVPTGQARLEVKVIPFVKPEPPLKCLIGVETPIADSLLGVAANLGSVTLEEIREERLAKYLK